MIMSLIVRIAGSVWGLPTGRDKKVRAKLRRRGTGRRAYNTASGRGDFNKLCDAHLHGPAHVHILLVLDLAEMRDVLRDGRADLNNKKNF